MPQKSIAYAVGRICVLERDALDAGRLERLMAAASYGEALRTLQEIGWTSAETTDYEQVAMEHVEKACALIREITPDPQITDCFLLRYDFQNLKILLKARCLGEKAGHLSACGTLSVDVLQHAVADHRYVALPGLMAAAMDTLEKQMAIHVDPMEIDVVLDHAMYAMIFDHLDAHPMPTVRQYFVARVDLLNALMILRVRAIGKKVDFFMRVMLAGGTIASDAWQRVWDKVERIPEMLRVYGRDITEAAQHAIEDSGALPAFECATDNLLLSFFHSYRHASLSFEPVVGYLLGRERESAAVRLILSGKANGFPMEAVRERLRDLYG
ncbi:MAG: V-type ATPase subunit [Clostridia bacterium]